MSHINGVISLCMIFSDAKIKFIIIIISCQSLLCLIGVRLFWEEKNQKYCSMCLIIVCITFQPYSLGHGAVYIQPTPHTRYAVKGKKAVWQTIWRGNDMQWIHFASLGICGPLGFSRTRNWKSTAEQQLVRGSKLISVIGIIIIG